ncbi:MAG: tripartite tricarboxylate transporter substrate binding protein [Pseudomonadota bacterium]
MRAFLFMAMAAVISCSALAQDAFPSKPVHIVVGFPPGGGADVVARAVAAKMNESLGQQAVVENRAGASGNIAAEAVARSPADGYMLYLATASNAINAAGAATGSVKLNYDVQKDLIPVALLVRNQNVLVANPSLPVSNLRELMQMAKDKPGKLNFGVMSPSSQLAGELFRQMAKIDITDIPYKGAAPVVTDLVGGQVELAILDVAVVLPQIRAGKLKALAVSSTKRFEGLPDVPTFAEAGVPGYEASGWLGLMAPAGTPPATVSRLRDAAAKALSYPDVRDQLSRLGVTPASGTSEDFGAFLRSDVDKWTRVLRTGNIKLGG